MKFRVLNAVCKLKTNPNGKGQIVQVGVGTWGCRVRLRKWGIKIVCGSTATGSNYERGADVKPVCTQSGGYIDTDFEPNNEIRNKDALTNAFLFYVRSVNTRDNGLHEFSGEVGYLWIMAGIGARIYSDGFNFNFIPTLSALDYDAPNLTEDKRPLEDYNVLSDDLATRLNRTPFDVIIGIPEQPDDRNGRLLWNRGHLHIRNEELPIPAGATTNMITCNGSPNTARIQGFAINREIGDQALYLDNATLLHDARYTAEFDIFVNGRFPHYTYTDFTPLTVQDEIRGNMFSKNAPFEILQTGNATLRSENTPTYLAPFTGTWQHLGGIVEICCINYGPAARGNPSITQRTEPNKETYLLLFPNPNADRRVTVQYLTHENVPTTLTIRNAQGVIMAHWQPQLKQYELATSLTFDLTPYRLAKGLYFITLTYHNKTITQKLILE
jgi:hypothetical protein